MTPTTAMLAELALFIAGWTFIAIRWHDSRSMRAALFLAGFAGMLGPAPWVSVAIVGAVGAWSMIGAVVGLRAADRARRELREERVMALRYARQASDRAAYQGAVAALMPLVREECRYASDYD